MLTSGHEYDSEDANTSACEQACNGCGASFSTLDVEVFDIDAAPVPDSKTLPVPRLPRGVSANEGAHYKSGNKTGCECGNSVSVHPHGIAEYRSK